MSIAGIEPRHEQTHEEINHKSGWEFGYMTRIELQPRIPPAASPMPVKASQDYGAARTILSHFLTARQPVSPSWWKRR
jgi:hypothetical protein